MNKLRLRALKFAFALLAVGLGPSIDDVHLGAPVLSGSRNADCACRVRVCACAQMAGSSWANNKAGMSWGIMGSEVRALP